MSDGPERYPAGERALAAIGLLLCVAAVVANEAVLARLLAADGTLEGSTTVAIRFGQGVLALAGAALVVLRARLAPRVDAFRPFASGRVKPRDVLLAAIALRVLVFLFLYPQNNDPHWEFVRFIVENGRLPVADELTLGFQPPLYYLLAAPFAIGGSMKLTQALSLVLSIANLLLMHRVLSRSRLLSSASARCHALVLAGFLPQFVLFSSFLSNDALAFPLGTLVYVVAFRYVEAPSRRNLLVLAAVQGVGLLTKGTLIGNLPTLLAVVLFVELRKREALARRLASVALFGATFAVVGCYKFVENTIHFGTPVVGNDVLEQEWVASQQGTWQGYTSLVDVDVLELVAEPFLSDRTRHSVPLLFYGTFWGSYIDDSNFDATRRFPWILVTRFLYLAGVVPTLLILAGGVALAGKACELRKAFRTPTGAEPPGAWADALQAFVVVLFLAGAVALVAKWGLKHDAWSFFQARLWFPAFLSVAFGLGRGVELVERRGPTLRWLVHAALGATWVLFAAYFAIELSVLALAG